MMGPRGEHTTTTTTTTISTTAQHSSPAEKLQAHATISTPQAPGTDIPYRYS